MINLIIKNNKTNVTLSILFIMMTISLFSVSGIASEKTKCKVLTVQASNNGKGMDSALSAYKSILKKAPFKKFNSFSLISSKTYQLSTGKKQKLSLPSSLGGTIEYKGKDKDKLKLVLNIIRPDKKDLLLNGVASSGVPFIVAGFKGEAGRWVFVVACD